MQKFLKWDEAELLSNNNRNLKYRLSNGELFMRSRSDDARGVRNNLSELKRLLRKPKRDAA